MHIYILVVPLLSILGNVSGQCTRELLANVTSRYLAAQTSGKTTDLPLGSTVTYVENDKTSAIASGILSQPLKIDFNRSLLDTTQCATYTEVVVTDKTHPYVIGTQMRLSDGMITRMESLVTDAGDWLFNASGTYVHASAEKWDAIPSEERDTRAIIQKAGDAYLDLFKNKNTVVPWGTPCRRLEGGMYTGNGSPSDSCNVGVPSGLDLTNRRYVVDEELGAVDIFLNFGGKTGLPDSHEFRVEGGKLRFVHTITVCTSKGCGM